MGPVHGAIVNWCGHKYGYRNFASDDESKNMLPLDFLTMGELFQNNHHKFGMSPSFAARSWEVDPTYAIMKGLDAIGVIDMTGAQKMRWTPADLVAAPRSSARSPRSRPTRPGGMQRDGCYARELVLRRSRSLRKRPHRPRPRDAERPADLLLPNAQEGIGCTVRSRSCRGTLGTRGDSTSCPRAEFDGSTWRAKPRLAAVYSWPQ